jgi:hypothetical protein
MKLFLMFQYALSRASKATTVPGITGLSFEIPSKLCGLQPFES